MGKITRATTEVAHENITIRAPRSWLEAIDKWCASQPVPPKRSDVIKLAVTQFIDRQVAEQVVRRQALR